MAGRAIALVGVVVGIPPEIAIGQAVWRIFAMSLASRRDPVVVAWVTAARRRGGAVVANLLALGPALVASRPYAAGELLRTQ